MGYISSKTCSNMTFIKRLKTSSSSQTLSKKNRLICRVHNTPVIEDMFQVQSFDIDSIDIVSMDNTKEYIESAKHYGSALTNSPTLVLNADYKPLSHLPLSLWNWQDSVRAVFANKAVVVSEYPISIRSVSYEMKLPSVIALKQFRKSPTEVAPGMTRKKVFIRDGFKCQVSNN